MGLLNVKGLGSWCGSWNCRFGKMGLLKVKFFLFCGFAGAFVLNLLKQLRCFFSWCFAGAFILLFFWYCL